MKKCLKFLAYSLLLVPLLTIGVDLAQGGTLDDIKARGKFIVGARQDAPPVGFFDDKGNWVGFSMDLAKEVHKDLQAFLMTNVGLEFTSVTSKTRIPLMTAGTIDMEATFTGITTERLEVVDFTLQHLGVGSRLLVPKKSAIKEVENLSGKRVGAVLGNFQELDLRYLNDAGILKPPARILTYDGHATAFLALQEGKIEAYHADDIVIASMIAKAAKPADWKMVGRMVRYFPCAFIVRLNDSAFRNFVNNSICKMVNTGKYQEIWDQWFGQKNPKAGFSFPMDPDFKSLLKGQCWPLGIPGMEWKDWPKKK